jgi:DNA-binding NarL/FixJ family response regulator
VEVCVPVPTRRNSDENIPRVLLADDHTMLLDLSGVCSSRAAKSSARRAMGAPRLAASTGQIIVLDVSMPRLNGMDACAQLRRRMPGEVPLSHGE